MSLWAIPLFFLGLRFGDVPDGGPQFTVDVVGKSDGHVNHVGHRISGLVDRLFTPCLFGKGQNASVLKPEQLQGGPRSP